MRARFEWTNEHAVVKRPSSSFGVERKFPKLEVRCSNHRRVAMDEMTEGYCDGLDLDCPEPSTNRSNAYRHGFANGRDDRRHSPRDTAANLRLMADQAIARDLAVSGRLN